MQDTEEAATREKFSDNGKPTWILKNGVVSVFIILNCVYFKAGPQKLDHIWTVQGDKD